MVGVPSASFATDVDCPRGGSAFSRQRLKPRFEQVGVGGNTLAEVLLTALKREVWWVIEF